MFDVSTDIGRFLSTMKFCAVEIEFKGNRCGYFATRSPHYLPETAENEKNGIDGNKIKIAVIKETANGKDVEVIKEEVIDFNDISHYRMAKIAGRAYLDTQHYD